MPIHGGVWDETAEYEALTIVLDESSGNSYISRKAAPAGTALDNESYWILFSLCSEQISETLAELETLAEELKEEFSDIVEEKTTELEDACISIASIEQTATSTESEGTNIWTVTLTNGTASDFSVQNGSAGETGVGIASLEQTASSEESGGENIWAATLTDGTTYTLTVTNGEKGDTGKGMVILGYYSTLDALEEAVTEPEVGDMYAVGDAAPYELYIYSTTDGWVDNGQLQGPEGVGIESLTQTTASSESGGENVWTATLTDGTSYSLSVRNGAQGESGVGIASLSQTASSSESGGENIWTATLTDGTSSTLTVVNGEKGETGKGMVILGYYSTLDALETAVTDPEAGDMYAVGDAAPYELYIYSETDGWVDNGQLQGPEGVGIESLTQTTASSESGGTNIWTATLTDGTTYTLTVTNGEKGDSGEDGAAATVEVGTVATGDPGTSVEITNSGTSSAAVLNFTIPQGESGVGVQSVSQTTTSSEDEGENVWTINLTDGSSSTLVVKNGKQGSDGTGIADFSQTSSSTASGGANEYTVTMTDGSSVVMTIYNGTQGAQGAQGEQGETGAGVPTGGSAGQVLVKDSSTNYDTSWQTMSSGSNVVVGSYTGSASTSSETAQTISLDGTPQFVWVGVIDDEDDVNYMGNQVPWYRFQDTDDAGDIEYSVVVHSGFALNGHPFYGGYDNDDSSDAAVAALEVTSGGFQVRNVKGANSNSTGSRTYSSSFYLNRSDYTYFYLAVLED